LVLSHDDVVIASCDYETNSWGDEFTVKHGRCGAGQDCSESVACQERVDAKRGSKAVVKEAPTVKAPNFDE
jgi:hypothetical protein